MVLKGLQKNKHQNTPMISLLSSKANYPCFTTPWGRQQLGPPQIFPENPWGFQRKASVQLRKLHRWHSCGRNLRSWLHNGKQKNWRSISYWKWGYSSQLRKYQEGTSLCGGFIYCFMFTPMFGEMIQSDEHIFQRGWFNHQLEIGMNKKVTP